MNNAAKKKLGPVVAVLNMKGGVGKTTISAHVFRHLYERFQKSTLLIDFDPQFNLTQTIISQTIYEKYKEEHRTILSVMEEDATSSIFKVSGELGPPPSVAEVEVVIRKLSSNPQIDLSLVPGDFDLVRYSLMTDSKILNKVKSRFLSFVENCRKEKDVVCIDCNPSSSFMTLCALEAATHILVPVRPDRYSILGLKMLNQFIVEMANLAKKPKMIVMLNGIKSSNYDPLVENTLRSDVEFGPSTMASSLHISKLLEASDGHTVFATEKKHNWHVTPRITAIVDELGKALGLV